MRLSRRDLLRPDAGNADRVHIASLLLQIAPAQVDRVRAEVASLPDAEFHPTGHPNKFAVVLEANDERELANVTEHLANLRGVLTIAIVAHLTEDQDALDEEA
jgi:nitrate reductase NapAB chaperone NapD